MLNVSLMGTTRKKPILDTLEVKRKELKNTPTKNKL